MSSDASKASFGKASHGKKTSLTLPNFAGFGRARLVNAMAL